MLTIHLAIASSSPAFSSLGLVCRDTSRSQTMIIEHANLLKKLRFFRASGLPAVWLLNASKFYHYFFVVHRVSVNQRQFPWFRPTCIFPLLVCWALFDSLMVLGAQRLSGCRQASVSLSTFWFCYADRLFSHPSCRRDASLMAFNSMPPSLAARSGVVVEGTCRLEQPDLYDDMLVALCAVAYAVPQDTR